MIDFNKPPLHPTDKELADFIDEIIDETIKERIIKHLVHCDKCMNIVARVKKSRKQRENATVQESGKTHETKPVNNPDYSSNPIEKPVAVACGTDEDSISDVKMNTTSASSQPIYVNNWFFDKKLQAIMGGLVASFLVVFVYYQNIEKSFLGSGGSIYERSTLSSTIQSKETKIDFDKEYKKIEKSLNVTILENFIKAKELEKQNNIDGALELYYQVFEEEIDKQFEDEANLKWRIVLNYHIAKIYAEKKESEISEDWQRATRDLIREYLQKYNK
ncbi:MAG: hypothetical protein K0U38_00905 [Epsilonproteobacteria bacterium]|nr:hypothetical protein [Campylobacterota bacterium]